MILIRSRFGGSERGVVRGRVPGVDPQDPGGSRAMGSAGGFMADRDGGGSRNGPGEWIPPAVAPSPAPPPAPRPEGTTRARLAERLLLGVAAIALTVPFVTIVLPEATPLLTVIGAGALAVAATLWAIAERARTRGLGRSWARERAALAARAAAAEALAMASPEAPLLWRPARGDARPAHPLIAAALAGPSGEALSAALEALEARGTAFAGSFPTQAGEPVRIVGRALGRAVAVWPGRKSGAFAAGPVLGALPVPAWLRRGGRIVWANAAAKAIWGDAEFTVDAELSAQAESSGGPVSARRSLIAGGERRTFTFTLTPVEGGILGIAEDVTALSGAEQALTRHLDAQGETLNRLSTAVAIFGADQRLVFANNAYAALWGFDDRFLEGRPSEGEVLDRLRMARQIPEQADYRAWKRQRLALYTRLTEPREEVWQLSDRTLRVVVQPHPQGLLFLFDDITRQVALESSLNTFIDVQRATLDNLHEAVAVFGPDGQLKLANAAFGAIWRVKPEEFSRRLGEMAEAVGRPFEAEGLWRGIIEAASRFDRRDTATGIFTRADGMVLAWALVPLPDGASLVSFVDVTDRTRVEQALRDRNAALETADRLKSEFIGHVSYQLRSPLNVIIGYTELLQRADAPALDGRHRGYVDSIHEASSVLLALINDILDLAVIEAGAMELEIEEVDMHRLLGGAVDVVRRRAEAAHLNVVAAIPDDIGTVEGDARRLRQIVFNLMSNAVNFTPPGGEIGLRAEAEPNAVRIIVWDTGAGMPPEKQATAFGRFESRLDGGARRTGSGAGLGLAIVNRFVDLHGGWVVLASEPGEGTTVTVTLPRKARARQQPPDAAE